MIRFIAYHQVFTLIIFLCFLGTVISYIAPVFTRAYLIADEDFCAGNTGITVFIHDGWGHFLGNMFYTIPGLLFCEKYYGADFTSYWIFTLALLTGLGCWIFKRCCCGFSGIALSLVFLSCMWGHHFWGDLLMGIMIIVELINTIKNDDRDDHLAHFAGMLLGIIGGNIFQP